MSASISPKTVQPLGNDSNSQLRIMGLRLNALFIIRLIPRQGGSVHYRVPTLAVKPNVFVSSVRGELSDTALGRP